MEDCIIRVPASGGAAPIRVQSIIRIEASSNYSKLFFAGGKTLVVPRVLSWFEAHLRENGFLRPHRSHLVNRNFITEYIDGKYSKLKLENGEWIDISKRRRSWFRKQSLQPACIK